MTIRRPDQGKRHQRRQDQHPNLIQDEEVFASVLVLPLPRLTIRLPLGSKPRLAVAIQRMPPSRGDFKSMVRSGTTT